MAQATPAAPTQWITDTVGFLGGPTVGVLNKRLEAYEHSTGHQVYVWIGKTTGGVPIEDWAVNTFKSWRVGRKGFDDGLVLFIMSDDRTARIEVGYGLEGQVPDVVASRIINDSLIPQIKRGDRDGAVSTAVDRLLTTLGGETAARGTQSAGPLNVFEIFVIAVALLVLLILAIRYPIFGYYLIRTLFTIARIGGGGSNSRGGGGRSGGGGASGKW